jgi:hypothetical protein
MDIKNQFEYIDFLNWFYPLIRTVIMVYIRIVLLVTRRECYWVSLLVSCLFLEFLVILITGNRDFGAVIVTIFIAIYIPIPLIPVIFERNVLIIWVSVYSPGGSQGGILFLYE